MSVSSQKKIFFFVTSLNSGGIENYLLRFLQFSEGAFIPIVICKSGKLGELKDKYDKIPRIRLLPLEIKYMNVLGFFRIYRLLKQEKPAAVCDFTGNFAGLVLFIARLLQIKTRIAFYRGAANRFKPTIFKRTFNGLMNILVKRCSTRILSNSKAALNLFFPTRNLNDKRFKVIYNGVDHTMFEKKYNKKEIRTNQGLPTDTFIIGHVGRYDTSKNLTTIANVAKVLCLRYSDIHFVICGKDTDIFREELITKCPELRTRFTALGYQSDVAKVLSMFDLFFFPSLIEGQPNALIEAMISGLPIITSDIPPIKETVPKKMLPFLASPMNVERFVNLIEKCYLHNEFYEELIFRNWAIDKYKPGVLFREFLTELI